MSGTQIEFDAAPVGDRAARQLAAMRLLFDADRERQRADVLLATVFEALAGGRARTTDELLRQVESDWPGVTITREGMESTLEVAAERGFLTFQPTIHSGGTWSITSRAELGVDDSKEWAANVLARCRAQVEELAREQGLRADHEQAERWTHVLLEVLHDGMIRSFTARPHDVREVANRLFPPYDKDRIIQATRQRIDDPDTAGFVAALALSALDPSSTFGTEVVHYLATGYVLYALMLGLDLTEHRETVGFEGEVLILDTPVLLRLLSGGREFRWTTDLVGRIARGAGATVVVVPRTRVELRDMLDRRDDDAHRLERELRDGVSRTSLAALTPDEVLAIWLREPSAPDWASFKASADGLFNTLNAIGVTVDFIPDDYTIDVARRADYVSAVREVTQQRGRPRHPVPSEHDGEMLCIADWVRHGAANRSDSLWPGAFVVTSDRSLTDAYRQVAGSDRPVMTLTVSQMASLLAELAQPADAERLAELIVTDLQWQTRFQRATAFGIDEAIEMARAIAATGHDGVLVEATSTELVFEELLNAVDYDGDPTSAARAAIVQQERRRRGTSQLQREENEREQVRIRERAIRAETEVITLRKEKDRQSTEFTEALGRSSRDASALQDENQTLKRSLVVVAIYLTAAMCLVTAVALNMLEWKDLSLPAVGMLAAGKWFYDWTRTPKQGLLGVVLAAVAWLALAVLGKQLLT